MTEPALAFSSLPTSGPVETRRVPLSRELWDIDWREELPHVLADDGIVVDACDFSEVVPFIAANYPGIFGYESRPSRFLAGGTSAARRRYYEAVGDCFVFRDGLETAGVLICTPVDWGTYYIRSTALLPEYQGRGLVQRFFPRLFERLRAAGVERVEAETAPSNFASLQILLRSRFSVTGTVLSERWGALVRLTRFLDGAAGEVFLDQFCDGLQRGAPAPR
ncbi:MAG TPA: GNAT family N-acetyltransferase [Polyangiaceae bacterium]